MANELRVVKGTAHDREEWRDLYWLYDGGIPDSTDMAVRRKWSDGQWYVTIGTMAGAREVAGPTGSVDAAVVLAMLHI